MVVARLLSALCIAVVGGCGDDGTSPSPDASAADSGPTADAPSGADGSATDAGAFALTSSDFAPGGALPEVHSCNGANTSPTLSWTPGPVGTMGYAVVFIDRDNELRHSAIWDIAASDLALPAAIENANEPTVPAGSKQPLSYRPMPRFGYDGPCPGVEHTYEFVLYAVDEYPLSGVTLDATRSELEAQLETHKLATVGLLTTYDPN